MLAEQTNGPLEAFLGHDRLSAISPDYYAWLRSVCKWRQDGYPPHGYDGRRAAGQLVHLARRRALDANAASIVQTRHKGHDSALSPKGQ